MIFEEDGGLNSSNSNETCEQLIRRRRNATKSESFDEQRGEPTNGGNNNLLSELETDDDEQQKYSDCVQRIDDELEELRDKEASNLLLDQKADVVEIDRLTDSELQEGANFRANLFAKKTSVLEYICMEISRRYSLQNEKEQYAEKRRKVYAFLRIPLELEKFIFYGFRQCLDSFCHMFTFLPIRVFVNLIGCSFRMKHWSAADTCDFLKLLIIFCASWCMQFVDTSVMYHLVRGQGIIKLYIFYNMLEVADKLFSSFGQDILDALLWTASEERRGNRKLLSTLFHLTVALIYALSHTLIILLQATTLNVAFNSHNQSLLTIMMSNNFVELKGAVFKKFGKPNLFQMSCSDVRERFHTVILLVVVVLRNMTAVNWKIEHLHEMTPDLMMIIFVEHIVDWLKHAFITKFNEINTLVYREYTVSIAYDVVRTHEAESFSDFSDQVSRRMGFVPIPITVLLIRVLWQSIDFESSISLCILASVWVLLLLIKIFNGAFMYNEAVDQIAEYKASFTDWEHSELEEKEEAKRRLFPRMFPL